MGGDIIESKHVQKRNNKSKESRNGNHLKLPHVWDSAETHVIG